MSSHPGLSVCFELFSRADWVLLAVIVFDSCEITAFAYNAVVVDMRSCIYSEK
jgi:hypothetical protein